MGETSWRDNAEDAQRVMVNMMSDLNCELLVTLGDARLDPDTEKKYLDQHEEWERYKAEHNITDWKPKKKFVKKLQDRRKGLDILTDAKIKPCRVMIKNIKMEEKVHLEVSSVWKNILGGMKKRKLDVENDERIKSPKKGAKKRKTSEFSKDVRAPLSL